MKEKEKVKVERGGEGNVAGVSVRAAAGSAVTGLVSAATGAMG